ncbi:MAG: TVP38/TMEM64 family protein [Acidobacteria bacterium]|nr:TVP38/TMEM64 family protein [Acidobacteriota bacterium]
MKRVLLLTALLAAVAIASKLLVENVLGIDLEGMVTGWLDTAGTGSALAIVILLAVDVFLPVPSSLVMVLSGAAFGVFWGALISLVGSIAGEWVGFELVRRYGQRASARMIGEDDYARFSGLFAEHGAAAIVVSRALPVVMETMSLVAGLSGMRRRSFLLASLIGTAPVVVVYAWAGAMSRDTGSLLPAVVILIAAGGAGWLWFRVKMKNG